MKKRFAVLISAIMALSIAVPNSTIAADMGQKLSLKEKISQLSSYRGTSASLRGANEESNGSIFINWDEEKNIPRFISGDLTSDKVNDSVQAIAFLNGNKDVFNIDNGTFKVKSIEEDKELGSKHYKTQMLVDGIPVYGSEIIVHTNSQGEVYAINGQAEPGIADKSYRENIKLTSNDAIKKAEAALNINVGSISYTASPKAELCLYKYNNEWKVSYEAVLQFIYPYPANWSVFVDAANGDILNKLNQVAYETATGKGVLGDTKTFNVTNQSGRYAMIDSTKTARIETYNCNYSETLPGTIFTDTDTVFDSSNQAAAVDAHAYAAKVFDYYKNTFNRNSLDDRGMTLRSSVHYGSNYSNAFWNGSQMAYGDGDGAQYLPFSCALDVIGHEMTHGVITNTCNLTYQNQSGALNESYADVMGVIIEGKADWWTMGEDLSPRKTPFRSMKTPTSYNQPDHMTKYVNTTQDNGGVHINSGIPNKAFYNIATVIGLEKSQNIYYKAMTQYLTSYSQFTDSRNALMQATADLYGKNSIEYYTIQKGYADVGIGSAPVSPPVTPTSTPTNTPTYTSTPTTPPTYKITGYIKPDFDFSNSEIKAGYKVELTGTQYYGTTDNNGYFEINKIPVNLGNCSIKISKAGYLGRTIENVAINGNIQIGSIDLPVDLWAGDINQDSVINMTDIIEMAKGFNSVAGDINYQDIFDIDQDSVVNMADIMIVVKHMNKVSSDYPAVVIIVPTSTPTIAPTNTPTATPTVTPTPTNGGGDYPAWDFNNHYYNVGDRVSFNGINYECITAHSSNIAWSPDVAFTLWRKV